MGEIHKRRLFEDLLNETGYYDMSEERITIAYKIFSQMLHTFQIFLRKNKQYGNSFLETGVRGAYIETFAKQARLRELVWRSPDEDILANKGDIEQNALDQAIYDHLLIYCLRARNIDGLEE